MSRTGRCHCGAVAYELDDPDNFNGIACYCTTCQRLCSSYSLNLKSEQSKLKVTKGSPTKYSDPNTDSGKSIHRYFCGTCGSTLFSDPEAMPGVRFVKVGGLDDAKDVKLVGEIYCDTAIQPLVQPSGRHGQKQWNGFMTADAAERK